MTAGFFYVPIPNANKMNEMYDFLLDEVTPWWQLLAGYVEFDHPLITGLNNREGWAQNVLPMPDDDWTRVLQGFPNGVVQLGLSRPAITAHVLEDQRRGSAYFSQCLMRFVAIRVGARSVVSNGYGITTAIPYIKFCPPSPTRPPETLPVVLSSNPEANEVIKKKSSSAEGYSAWRLRNPITYRNGYITYPTDWLGMSKSKQIKQDSKIGRRVKASVTGYMDAQKVARKELIRLSRLWDERTGAQKAA